MKRSKMIDEITCSLLSHAAAYPQFPLTNLQEAAEAILTMQEMLGMTPPKYNKIIREWEDVSKEGSTTYTREYVATPEWEPEDSIKHESTEEILAKLSIDELFEELDKYPEDKEYWAFIREEIKRRVNS